MLTKQRKLEILKLVDQYNRRHLNPRSSPFVARHEGRLDEVAREIQVDVKELEEFLIEINKDLPEVVHESA